jgi:N-acetyl-anhydromuramyl-L-alanine amidase AmpD
MQIPKSTTSSPRAVDLVVIHCSATESGKPLGFTRPGGGYVSCAAVIDGWHAQRGFMRSAEAVRAFSSALPSIGYHYVIDLDGAVYNGRHLREVGAHAVGYNARSVGICLVGGAEPVGRYTEAQWSSLAKVVAMLLADYGLPLAQIRGVADGALRQTGGVCGHRDLSPDRNGNGVADRAEWLKTCPGFDVAAWAKAGMRPAPEHIFKGD